MFKKGLTPEQAFVERAKEVARDLVQHESRGNGDTENAMRRLESRYGVPYGLLWSLRYRPPRDIMMGAWHRLMIAYEAQCDHVERLAQANRDKARALRNAAYPSAGEPDGKLAGTDAGALAPERPSP